MEQVTHAILKSYSADAYQHTFLYFIISLNALAKTFV